VSASSLSPVSLVLIDISGYTRFTKLHRLSALHAEQIISELLEGIVRRASPPLMRHEILGDAVSFYAKSDGSASLADEIRRQVSAIFEAFRVREGELISDCSLCICEACRNVGKLRLKAILHHGQAVFSQLLEVQKISGEDVILAHRLLKNSIPSGEYILETEPFSRLGGGFPGLTAEPRLESCAEFGAVPVRVFYPSGRNTQVAARPRSFFQKLRMSFRNDWYSLRRLFAPGPRARLEPPPRYEPTRSETARFIERTHFPTRKKTPTQH
jgi:Protein of unknown function (DUF2652)